MGALSRWQRAVVEDLPHKHLKVEERGLVLRQRPRQGRLLGALTAIITTITGLLVAAAPVLIPAAIEVAATVPLTHIANNRQRTLNEANQKLLHSLWEETKSTKEDQSKVS